MPLSSHSNPLSALPVSHRGSDLQEAGFGLHTHRREMTNEKRAALPFTMRRLSAGESTVRPLGWHRRAVLFAGPVPTSLCL